MIIPIGVFVLFLIPYGIYSYFVSQKLREYSSANDFSHQMRLIYLTVSVVIVVGVLAWVVLEGNPTPVGALP